MAARADKYSDNKTGAFYVDAMCIDCDVCRDTAPDHFTRNDEEGYSYVFRQPTSPQEIALCYEALNCCPVEAIGDDGE